VGQGKIRQLVHNTGGDQKRKKCQRRERSKLVEENLQVEERDTRAKWM